MQKLKNNEARPKFTGSYKKIKNKKACIMKCIVCNRSLISTAFTLTSSIVSIKFAKPQYTCSCPDWQG